MMMMIDDTRRKPQPRVGGRVAQLLFLADSAIPPQARREPRAGPVTDSRRLSTRDLVRPARITAAWTACKSLASMTPCRQLPRPGLPRQPPVSHPQLVLRSSTAHLPFIHSPLFRRCLR